MGAGKGIDFSANANAAGMSSELLDDYEEGTWTPIVRGRTTTGTGTYTRQSGYYTKVGNLVTAFFDVGWSDHTGTGGLEISLPFTVNSALNYPAGAYVSYNSGLSYTAGYSVYGWCDIGGSYVRVWQSNETGNALAVPMDTSVGEFHMTVTYLVD
jgi:hypothetical protein